MELKFTIRGEPKGKGRPKFSRQGNIVRTYTPDTTANYENYVKVLDVVIGINAAKECLRRVFNLI